MFTGFSIRAPNSNNVNEFYNNLNENNDMTSETRRYPKDYKDLPPRTGTIGTINRFDSDFFHFSQKQVDKMDIILRMLLETTQEALMDAKLDIDALSGSKTGVYVGHCFSDYLNRVSHDDELTGVK